MMMMMMMDCFCGMVDRRKTISLMSSWDHCQRSSPSRISDTPRARFEPVQNLSSGLVEWSCAVVITTTPRRHQQKKSLWGKIKLSNINLVLSSWNFFYLQSYVYLILQLLIIRKLSPADDLYSFLFLFILVCSFSKVWIPALWKS